MNKMLKSCFIVSLCVLAQVGTGFGQAPTPKKFNGFLGTYHPVNGTAYGGLGWKEGELIQHAFNFGQNAILVKGSHAGYTFEQNINNSCSEWDVNKVYGILLPPSEFGVVNQPTDLDIWKPFEKEPGMIQGMHRFSELSKRCPQIDGVIIDDLYNDFPKKISVEDLRDMRDALSGKHLDERGDVDHSSPATTPNLKLYFVVYEHHLDISPDKQVLDLIDGVCFWTWKQTEHYRNFDNYIKTVHRLYPSKDVIAGVYVRHSVETPNVASVHHMMERAIDLYAQGEINGMLIFSAVWLAQKDLTRERWEELGLPVFLSRKYYKFLGEGIGRIVDAKTKKPVPHVVVTVNRLIDGKVLNTTRKLTDEHGKYRFGGWAGKHAGKPVNYEITVGTASFKPQAMKVKLRAGKSRRFSDVLLRK
jgi:hypothetical protein